MNSIKVSFIGFFLLISSFGVSQQKKIDSLQNLVNSSKDTVKAYHLYQLSWAYRPTDPKKAMVYAEQCLTVANESKSKRWNVRSSSAVYLCIYSNRN